MTPGALFADLYEVTMAQAYLARGMAGTAVCETFFRKLPETRAYVMAAGLSDVLEHLETLRFTRAEIDYLRGLGLFTDEFLGALAKAARARLDAAGLNRIEIFASSGLDEYRIAALAADGSPIDAFAVGTKVVVSQDAPALDMAYKLVEYAGAGRTKFSSGKVIYPGRKQVLRRLAAGVFAGDTIARPGEDFDGEPLLVPVMKDRRRLPRHDSGLAQSRGRARGQIDRLPPALRCLDAGDPTYPVHVSPSITRELDALRRARQAR